MPYLHLTNYGLTSCFAEQALAYPALNLARVTGQHRDLYTLVTEVGEVHGSVSGKFLYEVANNAEFPVVGDWVMVSPPAYAGQTVVIHHILLRKSAFTRKAAGTQQATQIVAANIDYVFICMSLNADFNLRRLERYLATTWQSGATPVVVLTKADLCDDLADKLSQIAEVTIGAEVLVTSVLDAELTAKFLPYLNKQKTAVFLGSSGVGKSTLVNQLLGKEKLVTQAVGSDDSGRHTTTFRELFVLPTGGIVIDTPGMRELQLEAADLSKTFADIEELAQQCKFRNCSHSNEKGCAVLKAIAEGELSVKRLESYQKLAKEIHYEGLNSRQLEHTKINNMFGSMSKLKQLRRHVKNKHKK